MARVIRVWNPDVERIANRNMADGKCVPGYFRIDIFVQSAIVVARNGISLVLHDGVGIAFGCCHGLCSTRADNDLEQQQSGLRGFDVINQWASGAVRAARDFDGRHGSIQFGTRRGGVAGDKPAVGASL